MKETEQELLDEMIIKDVPESESSTDPVKKFEETLPSSNIESIKEEDSDTECKEPSITNLDKAIIIPEPSQPFISLTNPKSEVVGVSFNEPVQEPKKILVKTSSSSSSSSESKEEDAETKDIKEEAKYDYMTTTDSEAVASTLVRTSSSSSSESVEEDLQAKGNENKEENITTTDSEVVTSRPSSPEHIPAKLDKDIEDSPVILRRPQPMSDSSRPSSSDFSDAEFKRQTLQEKISRFNEMTDKPLRPISSEYESDEVAEVQNLRKESLTEDTETDTEQVKLSSRPTSSDFSEDKGRTIVADSSDQEEPVQFRSIKDRISGFNTGSVTSLDKMEITISSTQETSKVETRFTSSTEAEDHQSSKIVLEDDSSDEEEEEMKPLETVRERISRFNSGSVTSLDREPRPLSSQSFGEKKINLEEQQIKEATIEKVVSSESKIDERKESVTSIKDRISLFNSEKEIVEETYVQEKKEEVSAQYFEEKTSIVEQVKTLTTESNIEKKVNVTESSTVTSVEEKEFASALNDIPRAEEKKIDQDERLLATTAVKADQVIEKIEIKEDSEEEDEIQAIESIKDKISRFNTGSVTSLEKEPRPLSSDYSDIYDKKSTFEPKEVASSDAESYRPPSSSASSAANIEVSEKVELDLPVSSVREKISKFHLESDISRSADESAVHSRPASSDYSDIFDPYKREEVKGEVEVEDEPMESIKQRISRFNSGSVTSLDRDTGFKVSSRPSSGYSDFHEKKALFEQQEEETKVSKISLVSATSSESESVSRAICQSSSEYSESEAEKEITDVDEKEIEDVVETDSKLEDLSEVTEHAETVRETSFHDDGNSTDSEVKPTRPASSDYSDIIEKSASGTFKDSNGAIVQDANLRKSSVTSSSADDKVEKVFQGRPISSDYSDILDKNDVAKLETLENVTQSRRPVSSDYSDILDKNDVAKLENVEKVTSSGRPISSDYSDILDKKDVAKLDTVENVTEARPKESGSSISSSEDEDADKEMIEPSAQEVMKRESSITSSSFDEIEVKMSKQRPESSDYSDIFDKNAAILQESNKEDSDDEIIKKEAPKRSVSSSSSSEDEDDNKDKVIQRSSSDSSVSKQKSDTELTRQDAFDDETKKVTLRQKQSSSEYSESDVEGRKAVDSSSDYDSASNRGRRRPDSMISDASSDYDSLSNVGSRRPQSFILDDEYDVITEEGESERQPREDDESSSSSESEGPDAKDAGKKIKRIPPPGALKESSGEDEDQDGEETTTSEPTLIPQPPSSLANQSFLVSDMHVEQSSVSQTVEHSSVNVYTSKSLVETEKFESHSSNITKNMAELTENRSYESQMASPNSNTNNQTQKDGSSVSGKSQGIFMI